MHLMSVARTRLDDSAHSPMQSTACGHCSCNTPKPLRMAVMQYYRVSYCYYYRYSRP